MDLLRKYRYQIFLFTIIVFVSGIILGFGGYFLGPKGSPNDAIATVDGTKIPLRHFLIQYDRAMAAVPPGTTLDEAARNQKREEAMRDVIQRLVFDRESKRYKIGVPDMQVATSLASIPGFQTNGAFDPQKYGAALQSQLRMSPKEFEEEQRSSIAFTKLRWLLQSVIHVTDLEAETAWRLSHKGKLDGYAKEEKAFRDKLWQEKVVFTFNQWFNQIGQKTKVQTHFEVLQGMGG